MSIDLQVFLASYATIAVLVLLGTALILDADASARDRSRRYKALSDRERIWVGRAGLACLLWPLMGLGLLGVVMYHLFSTLVRAARGKL